MRELIIIGGGPAGYTAALYAARANLKPLVIEGFQWGGQLMITSDVENYPGYPDGVMGPEMMAEFRAPGRALRRRVRHRRRDEGRLLGAAVPRLGRATTSTAREAVIVATGASARWLGLESEQRLQGRGVSACATCDGAFFQDKRDRRRRRRRLRVRGGAVPDALRDEGDARPPPRRVPRLADHGRPRPREREDRVPDAVRRRRGRSATTSRRGVRLRNTETGETREIEADGLFVAIGHDPNTKLFVDQLDHDEDGYLVTKPGSTETNVPGVFAVGDVQDHVYRQAVTAAGSGCMGALDAERYLAEHEGHAGTALTAPRPEASGRSSPTRGATLGAWRRAPWIDLLDPTRQQLREHAAGGAPRARARQLLAPRGTTTSRARRFEAHGDYVFGVLLVAVAVRDEDRVYYQEIDFVADRATVSSRSGRRRRARPAVRPEARARRARRGEPVGMIAYHLVDEIAEGFLDLIDDAERRDRRARGPRRDAGAPSRSATRISTLRHDLLHIRRTLAPTRDAVRARRRRPDRRRARRASCSRTTSSSVRRRLRQAAARDRGLELSRDLLAGVRDYHQAKIANDQNEVMKRLTVIAAAPPRPDLHRRPLRPELPPHARSSVGLRLLVVVGLDRRHDDHPARVLPLEGLDRRRPARAAAMPPLKTLTQAASVPRAAGRGAR